MKRSWAVIIGVSLVCSSVYAEQIELKTGEVYDGEIVDRNDQYVAVSIGGAPIYLPADQVDKITKSVPMPTPSLMDAASETVTQSPLMGEPPTAPSEESVAVAAPADLASIPTPGYNNKDLKITFNIPDGFSIKEETPTRVIMANEGNSVEITVLRLVMSQPISDENIGTIGLQMVAQDLNHDLSDMKGLNKLVKLFGDRLVFGRKAYWFYYSEVNNQFLVYRAFVPTNDQAGFMIQLKIYPYFNNQYMDEGAKLANTFLDNVVF